MHRAHIVVITAPNMEFENLSVHITPQGTEYDSIEWQPVLH